MLFYVGAFLFLRFKFCGWDPQWTHIIPGGFLIRPNTDLATYSYRGRWCLCHKPGLINIIYQWSLSRHQISTSTVIYYFVSFRNFSWGFLLQFAQHINPTSKIHTRTQIYIQCCSQEFSNEETQMRGITRFVSVRFGVGPYM